MTLRADYLVGREKMQEADVGDRRVLNVFKCLLIRVVGKYSFGQEVSSYTLSTCDDDIFRIHSIILNDFVIWMLKQKLLLTTMKRGVGFVPVDLRTRAEAVFGCNFMNEFDYAVMSSDYLSTGTRSRRDDGPSFVSSKHKDQESCDLQLALVVVRVAWKKAKMKWSWVECGQLYDALRRAISEWQDFSNTHVGRHLSSLLPAKYFRLHRLPNWRNMLLPTALGLAEAHIKVEGEEPIIPTRLERAIVIADANLDTRRKIIAILWHISGSVWAWKSTMRAYPRLQAHVPSLGRLEIVELGFVMRDLTALGDFQIVRNKGGRTQIIPTKEGLSLIGVQVDGDMPLVRTRLFRKPELLD